MFDYPTPAVLAGLLRAELLGDAARDAAVPARRGRSAAAGEPVAIVGMGCRFPGGVRDPEELWELLAAGGDAISGFPRRPGLGPGRAVRPRPGSRRGPRTCAAGGFVHDAAEFDAGFFGISPREALAMDPQQRLLLEVCWEALERAGHRPGVAARLPDRGVRRGARARATAAGLAPGEGLEGYLLTGTAASVISGRVSYALGPGGPGGDGGHGVLVVAGGAAPGLPGAAVRGVRPGAGRRRDGDGHPGGVRRVLPAARAGRRRPVQGVRARRRTGSGWAEGAGMLVLERLSDARRNGHPVLAVVRGQRGEPGRGVATG